MITKKLNLKDVPLSTLTPYVRNPRINDPAVPGVIASLKEFGLVKNSVIVDEDMILICGHTTLKAMQALAWETAPDVTQVFGLTDAEKRAYRLADNRLGEVAKWDYDLLTLEFEELSEMEYNLDFTGFDESAREYLDTCFEEPGDGFFVDALHREKTPKMVTCPDCGREFEI